jgi:hypothetical protein
MFGRFFAFEMGCDDDVTPDSQTLNTPETVAFLNDDGTITRASDSSQNGDQSEGTPECDCQEMGCKKCKGKKARLKAKIITLTGPTSPVVPVMNLMPFQPSMIMLGRRNLF